MLRVARSDSRILASGGVEDEGFDLVRRRGHVDRGVRAIADGSRFWTDRLARRRVARAASRHRSTTTADVQAGTAKVPLTVGGDWGAGAYVVATLRRPLDAQANRMPGRVALANAADPSSFLLDGRLAVEARRASVPCRYGIKRPEMAPQILGKARFATRNGAR